MNTTTLSYKNITTYSDSHSQTKKIYVKNSLIYIHLYGLLYSVLCLPAQLLNHHPRGSCER